MKIINDDKKRVLSVEVYDTDYDKPEPPMNKVVLPGGECTIKVEKDIRINISSAEIASE